MSSRSEIARCGQLDWGYQTSLPGGQWESGDHLIRQAVTTANSHLHVSPCSKHETLAHHWPATTPRPCKETVDSVSAGVAEITHARETHGQPLFQASSHRWTNRWEAMSRSNFAATRAHRRALTFSACSTSLVPVYSAICPEGEAASLGELRCPAFAYLRHQPRFGAIVLLTSNGQTKPSRQVGRRLEGCVQ